MWVTITLTRSYGEEQRQLEDLAFSLLVAQGSSRSGILSGHLQTRDLSSGPQMWWFRCKDWSASGQQGFVHWTGAGFVVNALQSCKKCLGCTEVLNHCWWEITISSLWQVLRWLCKTSQLAESSSTAPTATLHLFFTVSLSQWQREERVFSFSSPSQWEVLWQGREQIPQQSPSL